MQMRLVDCINSAIWQNYSAKLVVCNATVLTSIVRAVSNGAKITYRRAVKMHSYYSSWPLRYLLTLLMRYILPVFYLLLFCVQATDCNSSSEFIIPT